MLVHVQRDVCNQDEIGHEMYAKYVVERINTNEDSVWATMIKGAAEDGEKCQKDRETQTCRSGG